MSQRKTPPFRADHVGSLLRPQRLLEAREAKSRGTLDAAGLRAAEDDCIREIVKLQEDLGYHGVTDGEFRRTWWHLDFVRQFTNITVVPPSVKARFRTAEGEIELLAPGLRVDGRLARPQPIMADDFQFLKATTRGTAKVTIPSPSVVHFRGGRGAIDAEAYPDIEGVYVDLARVYAEEGAELRRPGCPYLQLDDVNLPYLCEPPAPAKVRGIVEGPQTLPRPH